MAGISKIAELQARKQALVTESEICRENLKTEIDGLKAFADGIIRKVNQARHVGPWLKLAAPVAIPLVALLAGKRAKLHRQPRPEGKIAKALHALRLFGKYGPLARALVSRFQSRNNSPPKRRASASRYGAQS
jgi:hypothetical protein